MSPETFDDLLRHITGALEQHPEECPGLLPHASCGRQPIPLDKQLLITIWYLASGTETLVSIGQRFGICEASCYRTRKRLLAFIAVYVMPKVIRFPSLAELPVKIEDFYRIKGLGNIVGAVDGTHITIKAPKNAQIPRYFFNRKGQMSVQTQLCVDANMHIIDVYAGWPGSVHDAKVFSASPLSHLINTLPDRNIIIGDAAYPCQHHLVTPFKGQHLTDEQEIFKTDLSSTRMVVERAIGLLKGRFRRLMHYLDMWELEDIVQCILGACVLHEVALGKDLEDHIEEYVNEGRVITNREDENRIGPGNGAGVRRRDELMRERR